MKEPVGYLPELNEALQIVRYSKRVVWRSGFYRATLGQLVVDHRSNIRTSREGARGTWDTNETSGLEKWFLSPISEKGAMNGTLLMKKR